MNAPMNPSASFLSRSTASCTCCRSRLCLLVPPGLIALSLLVVGLSACLYEIDHVGRALTGAFADRTRVTTAVQMRCGPERRRMHLADDLIDEGADHHNAAGAEDEADDPEEVNELIDVSHAGLLRYMRTGMNATTTSSVHNRSRV